MLRIFCLIIVLFSSFESFAGNNKDFQSFLKILGTVESNNNDQAIGDGGKARGRYQIWEVCFIDAKQFDKSLNKYKYSDVTNKIVSEKVVLSYLNRYCPAAVRNNDFEVMSRTWNGGPQGKNKQSTIKYWQKFLKISLTL
jgi:hypothetical protein